MPNINDGFTGNEIVTRIQNYVGNTSQSFLVYLQQTLPLAEFRFCKMHDWKFLKRADLSLTITEGQSDYDLSVANIGYYMNADDVENIFDETAGLYLAKKDLNQIRRMDPQSNSGTNTQGPLMWCSVQDNKIKLWPKTFKTGTLKIDGKATPVALQNLANSPTIPYRYQESFIEYVIAMMLDRENDDRAPGKKLEAIELIKMDIKDDLAGMGNGDEPRIRSMFEKAFDGVGGSIPGYPFNDGE